MIESRGRDDARYGAAGGGEDRNFTMWQIELAGDALDIETVRKLAIAAGAVVAPGPDGRYCLGGSKFNVVTTAKEMRVMADEVLTVLNGLARLEYPQHKPVRTGSSAYSQCATGTLHHRTMLAETGRFRLEGKAVAFVFGPPGEVDFIDDGSTVEQEKRRRLVTDLRLAEILQALGDDISWQRLRIAFERLSALVGKGDNTLVKLEYATQEELRDFKKNIEDPRHSGLGAVHGVPRGPLKGKKISETEGLAFVTRLINTYLAKNQV